jgi:hypothetical protein
VEAGGGEAFVFIARDTASGRAERVVVRADGWAAGLVKAAMHAAVRGFPPEFTVLTDARVDGAAPKGQRHRGTAGHKQQQEGSR